MATILMAMATTRTLATATRWRALKRAMARVARAMTVAMAARAMATAMKKATAMDGEGDVDNGKSNSYSDK